MDGVESSPTVLSDEWISSDFSIVRKRDQLRDANAIATKIQIVFAIQTEEEMRKV